MASSIPIAACVFAFSLGPSPEKVLLNLYRSRASEERALAALTRAGSPVVQHPSAESHRQDATRRRLAIEVLARYRAALPALEAIVTDEAEPADIRADALRAIDRIDPRRAIDDAQAHQTRPDALGALAKALRAGAAHPAFVEATSLTAD